MKSNNYLHPPSIPPGKQVTPHTTYGPGRLLNQAYIFIGKSTEKRADAHKAGLGPIAVTEAIEKAFNITSEGQTG